jgi:CubicO group peptidase (beta-lactamase class C family)
MPFRFGIGYSIRGDGETHFDTCLPAGRIRGWGGWGGSLLIMDLDRRVTISYVMNTMANEGLATWLVKQYVKAVYAAIGISI